MLTCKKHPDYRVKRAPTADCPTCKALWATKLREDENKKIATAKYHKGSAKW
jgi:hypothetical protein